MSEGKPKKLTDLSKEDLLKFIGSFDTVLTDVDGVLWEIGQKEIEGAPDGVAALRKLGKQCYFITNNSTVPLKLFIEHRMKKFNIVAEDVIRPARAVSCYLKNINFDKEVYVIGFPSFKSEIENAGFKVVTDEINFIQETADNIEKSIKTISPNVGAVVLDFAINVNFLMLQKCVEYIRTNKALFIVGAWDPIIPFRGTQLIGTSFFVNAIEEVSGQKPILLSKPGENFNDIIVEELGPFDPKRVLFIGDSILTDMAFATKFGYQKLLPLTGFTRKEELEDWKEDPTLKPDYYVDSIKDFDTIIDNLGLNKLKL